MIAGTVLSMNASSENTERAAASAAGASASAARVARSEAEPQPGRNGETPSKTPEGTSPFAETLDRAKARGKRSAIEAKNAVAGRVKLAKGASRKAAERLKKGARIDGASALAADGLPPLKAEMPPAESQTPAEPVVVAELPPASPAVEGADRKGELGVQGKATGGTIALAFSEGARKPPPMSRSKSRSSPQGRKRVAIVDLRGSDRMNAADEGARPGKSVTGGVGSMADRGRKSRAGALVVERAQDSAGGGAADRDAGTASARGDQTSGREPSSEGSSQLSFRTVESTEAATTATKARSAAAAPAPERYAETLRNEVVRHATVLVREGDQGEIRLVLRPENLGSVRIRMQVSQDSVSGRIVVENAAVRQAVEEGLDALRSAFREEGYDTASLDVSVGGERPDSGQKDESGADKEIGPAVAVPEAFESTAREVVVDSGYHEINLIA